MPRTSKIPLVGSSITSAMSGFDAENPAIGLLSDSVQKATKAFESGEKEDYKKAMVELVENLGTSQGVPVTSGKRILKTLETGDPVELIGRKK